MSQVDADKDGQRGTDEGGKLKETGTMHWSSPNTGATNSSGFTALPNGRRQPGGWLVPGNQACFWTSTEQMENAWSRYLYSEYNGIMRIDYPKKSGLAVRCVKDQP